MSKEDISFLKNQGKELKAEIGVLRDNHIKHLSDNVDSLQKDVKILKVNQDEILNLMGDLSNDVSTLKEDVVLIKKAVVKE